MPRGGTCQISPFDFYDSRLAGIRYHIPSICLPTSCIDMALTIPLLRSYTYSFTGEDMVVMKDAVERSSDVLYCNYMLLYIRTRMRG
jgi:hypothetical protein